MNNNKNNTAHTAEESNKNIMLYGGIALVVGLIIVGIIWWNYGGVGNKKADGTPKKEVTEKEVSQLIKYSFASKECAEAIAEYQKEKTDPNKQKLQNILNGEKAENIQKAYQKHEGEIKKLVNKMASMMSDKVISDVEKSTQALKGKLSGLEGEDLKKVEGHVAEALKKLEEAKKAKTNQKRKEALTAAINELDACVKNTASWGTTRLIPEKNTAFTLVKDEIKKISEIRSNTPEEGDTQKYDSQSLKEALNKWNTAYRTIVDRYTILGDKEVAQALGLVKAKVAG